jgi:hypothetical protein
MIQRKRRKISLLKKVPFILAVLALLVTQSLILVTPVCAATSVGRVYAKEVVEDKSVTLVGTRLRANTRYHVYLSKYAKYPADAIQVGSAVTDAGGSFTKTFKIPGRLADMARISVNLTSSKGDTAFNWFINASSTSNTPGEGSPTFSFKVSSYKKGDWVKIKTINLPANVTFTVRMGKYGSKGINAVKVGELRSNKGGSMTAAFDIPAALQGLSKIDIRVENVTLGIAYYVTFKNQ